MFIFAANSMFLSSFSPKFYVKIFQCWVHRLIKAEEDGLKCNFSGFFCSTFGSFQNKYNVGSFELLSKTAPIQAASLLCLGPFLDYILNGRNILEYQFSGASTVSLKELVVHQSILNFEIYGYI